MMIPFDLFNREGLLLNILSGTFDVFLLNDVALIQVEGLPQPNR